MELTDYNSNIVKVDISHENGKSSLHENGSPEPLLWDNDSSHHCQQADNNKDRNKSDNQTKKKSRLLYVVDSNPPWSVTLLYAVQQVLTMISGPVTAAFIIRRIVCAYGDQEFLSQLISTNLFMSGLCTIIQVSFGIRLPVIQGSSFSYIPVLVSMMSSPEWKCPSIEQYGPNGTLTYQSGFNTTTTVTYPDLWRPRMMEASGALILASLVQVFLGWLGLIGFFIRFIGPLTVAPTVMLIGLSITGSVVSTAKNQWGIALGTSAVIVGVLSFLRNVEVPVPSYSRSRGCHTNKYHLFRLFPQAIAIIFGWSLCGILTAADVFPDDPKQIGYLARTDINLAWISQSSWFFIPYPGMWGWPTFNLGLFFGMFAAVISSTIESVGDYYATARAAEAPQPPKHAMNRGISMEGLGSVFCGLFGAAHATTSYSGVIGYISLTGMASRRTWIFAGVFLMTAGVVGKISAVLSTIPEPVIGGLMTVGICMVIGVGISTLQLVDLSSGRNLLVIGLSLLFGTAIPLWIKETPGAIQTGNVTADQVLTIVLSTSMLIGGLLAFTLDNLLPATRAERGFRDDSAEDQEVDSTTVTAEIYNLPLSQHCVSLHNRNSTIGRILSFVPFLPCYIDREMCNVKCRKSDKQGSLCDDDDNCVKVTVAQ